MLEHFDVYTLFVEEKVDEMDTYFLSKKRL
jgi:hypothetical protein